MPKLKKSVTIPAAYSNGEEEQVLDDGSADSDLEDIAVAEEALVEAQEDQDDGQVAHDDAVVKSLHDIAIHQMAEKGVTMMADEEKVALKVFPAVLFNYDYMSILFDHLL